MIDRKILVSRFIIVSTYANPSFMCSLFLVYPSPCTQYFLFLAYSFVTFDTLQLAVSLFVHLFFPPFSFFSPFHSLLPPLSSSPFSFFFPFSHPLPPSTEGRSTRVHDETFIALPYFFSSHRVLTLLVPLHTRFSKYEIRTDPSPASRSSCTRSSHLSN